MKASEFSVYVPSKPEAMAHVNPGSAIVGGVQEAVEGRVCVDYEGNIYQSSGLEIYADRALHAAGRHADRYPTVARVWAKAEDLIEVGYYNDVTGDVWLHGPDERRLLAEWLGVDDVADEELHTTAVRHQMRREVAAAMAHPDPAMRAQAEFMRRRYKIDL